MPQTEMCLRRISVKLTERQSIQDHKYSES